MDRDLDLPRVPRVEAVGIEGRERAHHGRPAPELVWTGPETRRAAAREAREPAALAEQARVRIGFGRRRIKAVDIGEKDEQVGAATAFFGATAAFNALHTGLDTIWKTAPTETTWLQGIKDLILSRLLSFLMVLAVGLLLLLSLAMSTALAAVDEFMPNYLPLPPFVLDLANRAVSWVLITLLFAAVYAVRPKPGAPVSAPCTWGEVASGAVGPRTFTLRTLPDRAARVGDLWKDLR